MENRSLGETFAALLERADVLGHFDVSHDEVVTWSPGTIDSLVRLGLLAPASNATGLTCDGCEESCWVEPELRRSADDSSTLLHVCHLRPDIGLLRFQPQRLQRWTIDVEGAARHVAAALTRVEDVVEVVGGALWRLGERRINRALRPLYLLAPAVSMNDAISAHLTDRHAVLLCPHVRAAAPCRSFALTELFGCELEIEDSVLTGLLGRRQAAPRSLGRIGIPEGTTWSNITLRVIDEHTVEIVAGQSASRRRFDELGMLDRRRRDPVPNAAWTLLLVLARNGGSLGWGDDGASANARQHMKSLRSALREAFGVEADPIHEYKRERCWRTRFNLVDRRDGESP